VVPQSTTPVAKARSWAGRNTALAVGGGVVALVAAVVLGAGIIFGGDGPDPTRDATLSPLPTEPSGSTVAPVTAAPSTAAPTAGPTAAPSTDPNAFPNEAEVELMAVLPSPLVDTSTCTRLNGLAATAIAGVSCFGPPGAAWQAVFSLYEDPETLDQAYSDFFANFARTATSCFELVQSNSDWWFENTPDVVRGRLACYAATQGSFSGIQYVWTYGDIRVMASWLTTDYSTGLEYFKSWVSGAGR
jgi:hypothetical protein